MAANDAQRCAPSTWQSLPTSVLGRCLLAASGKEYRGAAFSTCTSFTKAMLSTASETQLTVYADSFEPALATVLGWATECEAKLQIRIKRTAKPWPQSALAVQLGPLTLFLWHRGVCLPSVVKVHCEGLRLTSHPTASLHSLFPNLEDLSLHNCLVDTTKLPLLPLTGCSKLQRLRLDPKYWQGPVPSTSEQQAWLLQLQQVASLPSLTSIALTVPGWPTSFLPMLAGQLTEIRLHFWRQDPGRVLPLEWQSAVSHAAQCTNLRALQLSNDYSAEHLCTLVTSLPQLQKLTVGYNVPGPAVEDSDALISALSSAPHLTHLSFKHLPEPLQLYADSSLCTWQQLSLEYSTPQLLSKLPLHSLTQPLQLEHLHLGRTHTVAEVQAAVDNLARSQAAPRVVIKSPRDAGDTSKHFSITFNVGGEQEGGAEAGQIASPADLLRAAVPLLPRDATHISLIDCRVDAAVVTALQQVAAPTLKSLYVGSDNGSRCGVEHSFWPQLARSFPQLDEVTVDASEVTPSPMEVVGYFLAASVLRGGLSSVQGVPKVARIIVFIAEEEDDAWGPLVEQLEALGFQDPIKIEII